MPFCPRCRLFVRLRLAAQRAERNWIVLMRALRQGQDAASLATAVSDAIEEACATLCEIECRAADDHRELAGERLH